MLWLVDLSLIFRVTEHLVKLLTEMLVLLISIQIILYLLFVI